MNAASILRSKAVAVASAGFLSAGLLGGVAFAATPATTDAVAMTAINEATGVAVADKDTDRAHAKLKAALDALVAKNVITQSQEDAILDALTAEHRDGHPKLREMIGNVVKASIEYLGTSADNVKQQLAAGMSLGDIANNTAGKSRDGLVQSLDASAATRIKAAVDAGKLTQAQADKLTPKVDDGIAKIVDHKGAPRPKAAGGTTVKPTPQPTN
jgi:hypothetical protein